MVFTPEMDTTMNDNVGDMPPEIFADYVSDMLGEEWSWEYLVLSFNNHGNHVGTSPEFFYNCDKVTGYGNTLFGGSGTSYGTMLYDCGAGFWQGYNEGYGCGFGCGIRGAGYRVHTLNQTYLGSGQLEMVLDTKIVSRKFKYRISLIDIYGLSWQNSSRIVRKKRYAPYLC